MVQDDPKLPGDSGEVPVFEWSGWWFDFQCEIFSLLDGKKNKSKKSTLEEVTIRILETT